MTMRFQTRAFLFSFVPFAVLLASSFFIAQKLVQSTVRDELRGSLRENQLSMAREQSKADFQNGRFLKIAGESADLKAAMQLINPEPGHGHPANSDSGSARRGLEDQLRGLGEQMGSDFLSVSKPDGAPLAGVVRQTGDQSGGKNQLVPFDGPLIEHGEKGLLVIGGRIIRYASVPIEGDKENIGSLSVGQYFDFPGAAKPSVLIHDGAVIDFNIPDVSGKDVEAAFHRCAGQPECDVRLGGANWISVPLQRLGDGYTLWSLENFDAARGPVRSKLRNLFLIMAFGSVLVAFLCSLVSSRSIVKPIAHVVSHLRNAERTGMLPDFTSDLSPTMEIRELAESYQRAAESVRNAQENLQRAYVEFVRSLANALDARDRYTSGHSYRVSQLSSATAAAMGLVPEEIERIRVGALLHDIGKIGIDDSILQKADQLTLEEFEIVKQHPVIGRRILEGVQGLAPYIDAVELHHENWDGTGYPKGQSGEETPLDARIIHVSDAYDAMTTERSYRRGMTHEQAIGQLLSFAGTQFDPRIVQVFAGLPRPNLAGPANLLDDREALAQLESVVAG
ncbi:MAG: HD-GYP domain-containing protein [Terracidiphilus sp.]